MQDIVFDCPHCSQNLSAPEDMAGLSLACPACSELIRVPVPPGLTLAEDRDEPVSDDKASTGLIVDDLDEESKKGSTVRIDVPEEYQQPHRPQRIIKIKRLK